MALVNGRSWESKFVTFYAKELEGNATYATTAYTHLGSGQGRISPIIGVSSPSYFHLPVPNDAKVGTRIDKILIRATAPVTSTQYVLYTSSLSSTAGYELTAVTMNEGSVQDVLGAVSASYVEMEFTPTTPPVLDDETEIWLYTYQSTTACSIGYVQVYYSPIVTG